MGFGAPNIILDEAGQISDELYATVKRMVGGAEGTPDGIVPAGDRQPGLPQPLPPDLVRRALHEDIRR
jgi:hypothetical protein